MSQIKLKISIWINMECKNIDSKVKVREYQTRVGENEN